MSRHANAIIKAEHGDLKSAIATLSVRLIKRRLMLILMVPSFWTLLLGIVLVPAYGDAAAALAVTSFVLMLVAAVA